MLAFIEVKNSSNQGKVDHFITFILLDNKLHHVTLTLFEIDKLILMSLKYYRTDRTFKKVNFATTIVSVIGIVLHIYTMFTHIVREDYRAIFYR